MFSPALRTVGAVARRAALSGAAALALTGPLAADEGPFGRWLVEDIGGAGVIDRLQTTLQIEPPGAASGFGGCNRFRGRADVSSDAIAFGPLASTRKMCIPAVSNQEAAFFKALASVRRWSVNAARGTLTLRNGAGRALIRLTRLA